MDTDWCLLCGTYSPAGQPYCSDRCSRADSFYASMSQQPEGRWTDEGGGGVIEQGNDELDLDASSASSQYQGAYASSNAGTNDGSSASSTAPEEAASSPPTSPNMRPIVAEEEEPTPNPSSPPTSSMFASAHDLTISSSQFNQVGRDQHSALPVPYGLTAYSHDLDVVSHVTHHHHVYNPLKIFPIPLPLPFSPTSTLASWWALLSPDTALPSPPTRLTWFPGISSAVLASLMKEAATWCFPVLSAFVIAAAYASTLESGSSTRLGLPGALER
ncbi:hypothetical protein ONZ45_g19535 [Pleurotus djamor]|nr:hypothetical protein ONZ45_g19535 [Pleurotus djamor]